MLCITKPRKPGRPRLHIDDPTLAAKRARYRARYAAWAATNPEKMRENSRRGIQAWRRRNPGKSTSSPARRAAAVARRGYQQHLATPKWLTAEHWAQMDALYKQAQENTRLSGAKFHVDHIEPIQGKDRSGLHVPWNMRVVTASENIAKGNRT